MNDFKRANTAITHAKIISDYEDKVRALRHDNERLIGDNEKLENARYFINSRIGSLRNSLKRQPDKNKQAQLELCLDIREELK